MGKHMPIPMPMPIPTGAGIPANSLRE